MGITSCECRCDSPLRTRGTPGGQRWCATLVTSFSFVVAKPSGRIFENGLLSLWLWRRSWLQTLGGRSLSGMALAHHRRIGSRLRSRSTLHGLLNFPRTMSSGDEDIAGAGICGCIFSSCSPQIEWRIVLLAEWNCRHPQKATFQAVQPRKLLRTLAARRARSFSAGSVGKKEKKNTVIRWISDNCVEIFLFSLT